MRNEHFAIYEMSILCDPLTPSLADRQDLYQPGIISTDARHDILCAHPTPKSYRARLASNGRAIIVSLAFLEEQAASVTETHLYILPIEPELEQTWVELFATFHSDDVRVKDRALAQLQHSSRFNFLEEKGLQLDAYTFREG